MELPLPIKYEEIQREAVSTCPAAVERALHRGRQTALNPLLAAAPHTPHPL